jgi:hypothetical protein
MGSSLPRIAAGALIVLLGCAGPSIHYDYDANTHFSTYQTFAWQLPAQGPLDGAEGFNNTIMSGRVQRAVEAELGSKGYKPPAESSDPDFLVSYHPLGEGSRSHQVHLGLGFGVGPLGLGIGAPVGDPQRTAVGAIVLEVRDFRSRAVVWQATAPGALEGSDSPEQADSDVKEAIHSMLKRFPPPGN